jgi:hypothetical protein
MNRSRHICAKLTVVLTASVVLGSGHAAAATGAPAASTVQALLVQSSPPTTVQIGEHTIDINVTDTGADVTFIRLHENEMPAGVVGVQMNTEVPSRFIDLSQRGDRNITFRLAGSRYSFDPNTIFSASVAPGAVGIPLSPAATKATATLADAITSLLIPGAPVIALHNNRGTLLASYASGPFKKCTHAVYVNPGMDSSTFAVVPTQSIFEAVKAVGISVVWENRAGSNDDGSLLAYAQRNHIPYINIETGMGSSAQAQLDLVRRIVPIVQAETLAGPPGLRERLMAEAASLPRNVR